jgi:hypothetical protein
MLGHDVDENGHNAKTVVLLQRTVTMRLRVAVTTTGWRFVGQMWMGMKTGSLIASFSTICNEREGCNALIGKRSWSV